MIDFSPLSSTHTQRKRRNWGCPLLLLLAMIAALAGWIKAHYLHVELSKAETGISDLQASLSIARQNLSDTQAKLSAAQDQNVQLQAELTAAQNLTNTRMPSNNTATISSPQAPSQQTSPHPHASSR